MTRIHPLEALERFFASWRFPVVALAALGSFELGLVAVSLIPRADAGLGHFAEQFRIWCWGYDPATGAWQWAYVASMLGAPVTLGTVIALVWLQPLRAVLGQARRATLPWACAGLFAVVVALGVLVASRGDAQAAELPFPARALRTAHPAIDLSLTNQDGRAITLSSLRGKVVLLTGMYASCTYTCPLIMAQAKRAIAALEAAERRDVVFVAVTLDPAHDDQAVLERFARGWGVRAPEYHFLWGEPKRVNQLLDRMEIARTMDMTTGAIDHANLFILLDKRGKVAYRLSLSQRQENWLVDALRVLAREPAPNSG